MDWKKQEATKRMYVVACKDSNELFIDVVIQEARLLQLNINLFSEKKKDWLIAQIFLTQFEKIMKKLRRQEG